MGFVDKGIITARSGLWLHAQPDKNSEQLRLMPYGSRVDLIVASADNAWMRVKWGNLSGWAAVEYIDLTGLPPDVDPTPPVPPKKDEFIVWSIVAICVLVILSVVWMFAR